MQYLTHFPGFVGNQTISEMQREANYHELNHNCQHYVQRLAKKISMNPTTALEEKVTAQLAVLGGVVEFTKNLDEVVSMIFGWEPGSEEEIWTDVFNHFTLGWALKSAWDRRNEDE